MDNYFTSVSLAKFLFQNKLNLIGTVRHNKNEIPPSFLADRKKRCIQVNFHSINFWHDKHSINASNTP